MSKNPAERTSMEKVKAVYPEFYEHEDGSIWNARGTIRLGATIDDAASRLPAESVQSEPQSADPSYDGTVYHDEQCEHGVLRKVFKGSRPYCYCSTRRDEQANRPAQGETARQFPTGGDPKEWCVCGHHKLNHAFYAELPNACNQTGCQCVNYVAAPPVAEGELPPLDMTEAEGYGKCLNYYRGALCELSVGHEGEHYDSHRASGTGRWSKGDPFIATLTDAQVIDQRERQLRQALSEVSALRQENERLMDLVQHQLSTMFHENLISADEAWQENERQMRALSGLAQDGV